ncbi:hypothetical protein [Novosphingobium sp. TCA1]|uniref:hypothetical protein n=1 Tax=Novosphingobium sp. TCA1 TaxID=2682474 RepID=UPI001306245D|nr:hypothetical protein [Novosphingobium sp. TCA1]GFE73497.1 hypothetical protein NTCA1_11460 [Novosphingobium sp. TCA1]
MKVLIRIAIGLPLVLVGIGLVAAAIYFLGEWSLLVIAVILFSWCVGDSVISHRAIRALRRPRECVHDWRRVAASWFAYESNPGKYFVMCSKCRARGTRKDIRP